MNGEKGFAKGIVPVEEKREKLEEREIMTHGFFLAGPWASAWRRTK